jgi:hypothetical protein
MALSPAEPAVAIAPPGDGALPALPLRPPALDDDPAPAPPAEPEGPGLPAHATSPQISAAQVNFEVNIYSISHITWNKNSTQPSIGMERERPNLQSATPPAYAGAVFSGIPKPTLDTPMSFHSTRGFPI